MLAIQKVYLIFTEVTENCLIMFATKLCATDGKSPIIIQKLYTLIVRVFYSC